MKNIYIEEIPAILWGSKSDKLFIAVHGSMSHKSDTVIEIFVKKALILGYQVLSFDLPKHGARKEKAPPYLVDYCKQDLQTIMAYAKQHYKAIGLMACSLGAYFSLLAYAEEPLFQSLFLSPVVNLQTTIENMMKWSNITEEELELKKEIPSTMGPVLSWEEYSYVKAHPIKNWHSPTSILCGEKDAVCELEEITSFSEKHNCRLVVMSGSEHFFHTEEQLEFYGWWLNQTLLTEI